MDSSVQTTASQPHDDFKIASSAWEEGNEESELETEDESVMPETTTMRARPRFADMRSEGSWSVMSDRDPVKMFKHLMGSVLGPSPAASPRLSQLLLNSPKAPSLRSSRHGSHRRDSTLAAFHKIAGALLMPTNRSRTATPKTGFRFPRKSLLLNRETPRKSMRSRSSLLRSPRRSLLTPALRGGSSSRRRHHRRESTLSALRHIAGALLTPTATTSRDRDDPHSLHNRMYTSTVETGTLLTTPSATGRGGTGRRADELFDAVVGALIRLQTATPRSRGFRNSIAGGKKKKRLKLVWVDESEEESEGELVINSHPTPDGKQKCCQRHLQAPGQRKFSKQLEELDDGAASDYSDAATSEVIPVGGPKMSVGDEQKPSVGDSGLLSKVDFSDDEASVVPVGNPVDEQKPSGSDISNSRHAPNKKQMSLTGGRREGFDRESRRTVRVINLQDQRHSVSTEDNCSSCARLGDLTYRSDNTTTEGKASTQRTETGDILLRLIDLHSRQMGLTSEAAEQGITPSMTPSISASMGGPGLNEEELILKLSELAAASTSPRRSARTPGALPKTKELRRQQSDDCNVQHVRRRKRTASVSRTASDPSLMRLRPLINPRTREAACCVM